MTLKTRFPELNESQLKMLQRMIEECIPEKLPVPMINGEEMQVGTGMIRGRNAAVQEIRNNLRAKGLIV